MCYQAGMAPNARAGTDRPFLPARTTNLAWYISCRRGPVGLHRPRPRCSGRRTIARVTTHPVRSRTPGAGTETLSTFQRIPSRHIVWNRWEGDLPATLQTLLPTYYHEAARVECARICRRNDEGRYLARQDAPTRAGPGWARSCPRLWGRQS